MKAFEDAVAMADEQKMKIYGLWYKIWYNANEMAVCSGELVRQASQTSFQFFRPIETILNSSCRWVNI